MTASGISPPVVRNLASCEPAARWIKPWWAATRKDAVKEIILRIGSAMSPGGKYEVTESAPRSRQGQPGRKKVSGRLQSLQKCRHGDCMIFQERFRVSRFVHVALRGSDGVSVHDIHAR